MRNRLRPAYGLFVAFLVMLGAIPASATIGLLIPKADCPMPCCAVEAELAPMESDHSCCATEPSIASLETSGSCECKVAPAPESVALSQEALLTNVSYVATLPATPVTILNAPIFGSRQVLLAGDCSPPVNALRPNAPPRAPPA